MAISERIKAEARRTIDGMQAFYEKYSEDPHDAEELEHRIARVEASMEGCNGFTQEEKVQKTAENVFELTCAQERSYDALRMEIKRTRDLTMKNFALIKEEIKTGLDGVMKKIEDSGTDSSCSSNQNQHNQNQHNNLLTKVISEHPLLAFSTFIFILILAFVSGHFQDLANFFGK